MKSLKLLAAAGLLSLGVTAANANPISLYYSFDGSNYTQLGQTTTNGANQFSGSIGATFFATLSATGTGSNSFPLPEPYLNTSTIAINSTAAGTIYLAALETDLTAKNFGGFSVSFGGNAGNAGTITESFLIGTSLSGNSPALLSYTLAPSTANATLYAPSPALTGTYQVAEIFKVSFERAGTIQGTIQEQTVVPEPASMALIGAGLLAFGLVRRKKA